MHVFAAYIMYRGQGGLMPEMAEADGMPAPMPAPPGPVGAPAPPPPPPPGGINTNTAALPAGGGGGSLQEVTRVRTEFPEAWIWADLEARYYRNFREFFESLTLSYATY